MFVEREFAVGKERLKDLLVVLQGLIATDEVQHLFEDIGNFFFDLVEHPLIDLAGGEDTGVFEVDEVA